MSQYKQLTEAQRYQIAALLKAGQQQKDIARCIGVSAPTISRELKRNIGVHGYSPVQAHQEALKRRREARKTIKMTMTLIATVEAKIRMEWSPEQVSGWLKTERFIGLSHERIYQHVWADKRQGGTLYTHLRQSNKARKKRYGSQDRRGQIKHRVSIDERPTIVDKKTRIGDWEIDTVIGKHHQGVFVTIVDRLSKYTLIKRVDSKHAAGVTATSITLLKPYLNKVLTITADNGKEFAWHALIAKHLKTNVYFAHPYHSWERGLNKNTNGLIRQYFPKGISFEEVTESQVNAVMDELNHRPRKTLNYKTPHAVFFDETMQGCCMIRRIALQS